MLSLALFIVQATRGSTEKCVFMRIHHHPIPLLGGQCEQKCDLNPQCTHFQADPSVFHFRLGFIENCYLLKGNVSWSDSRPSPKQTCGIKNTWTQIGDDYMGKNCLFEFLAYRAYPLQSEEDCFQLCKEHSRCTHFNYIMDARQRTCQLMQGLHKGMKDTTLVVPKVNQAISCGFMTDYKLEKTDVIEETSEVTPEDLQDDYSYYYYACSYLGGLLSALILYLLCCTCAKSLTTSAEI